MQEKVACTCHEKCLLYSAKDYLWTLKTLQVWHRARAKSVWGQSVSYRASGLGSLLVTEASKLFYQHPKQGLCEVCDRSDTKWRLGLRCVHLTKSKGLLSELGHPFYGRGFMHTVSYA